MRQEGELFPFIVVDPTPDNGLAAACLQEGALACVAPEALADCVREALGHVGPAPANGLNPADVDLLGDVVNRSMEGIVMTDVQGRIAFVNPAAAELLGYTREEMTGRDWTLIIPPDQQAVVRAADSRRAEGQADRYELELVRRDGRRVPVLVSASPRFSAREFAGSVAIFTDISELKHSEEALRATNETLRAMIQASPLAITVLAPDGIVRTWNAAAEKIFGWTESEAVGRFLPIVPPDLLDEHRLLRERAMRGDRLDGIEVVRRRKDGSPIDVRVSTAPIRNAAGEVTGILGIMADITEAKRTEASLRESEEKFRSLAEESPNMIFIYQGGRVVYANPQAATDMGYSREELYDSAFDFMCLIAPDSRDLIQANLERHRRGEEVPPYTYALITRDDRRIEAIHTTRLIRYGGVSAILGIVTDISEQHRAEAAMERRASQLQALSEIGTRVASVTELKELLERTASLLQERFGYEHVGIFLRRDGDDDLEMRARAGAFAALYPPDHRVTPGRGMVGSAAALGQVLLANDVTREPRYINYFPGKVRTRSELSLPIRTGGTTVGVLDIQSTQAEAFGENDVLVLGILSDQLGAAIADARLYEALRASEERYRALTENAAVGIYRTAPDGRILFINPAGLRMLGFDSYDELAQRNLEAEGFESAYPRRDFKERLEREDEIVGMESAWKRRDGTTIYVRENARVLRDEGGRALYYEGTVEDITPRKHAEEALEQHAGELQVLYETSLEVSRHTDVDVLLQTIIERAARLVGTNSGGLYLVRPERQVLEMVVSYNLPRDFVGVQLKMGEGLSGQVALRGEPMAVADYSNWASRSAVYDGYHFGRALGVPLRRGADILGVIVITDPTQAGEFTPEEVRLVSLFADQAALALENARLLEAERARLGELAHSHGLLTALSQVAAIIEHTEDPDEFLHSLGGELQRIGLGCGVAIVDHEAETFVVRFTSIAGDIAEQAEKVIGTRLTGLVIPGKRLSVYRDLVRERMPVFVLTSDLIRQILPRLPKRAVDILMRLGNGTGTTWTIGLPLMSKDLVTGVLFVWGEDLQPEDVAQYSAFASQVAVGLEKARLIDEMRQHAAYLGAVVRVAGALRVASTREEMLPILLDQLLDLMQAEGTAIEALLPSGVEVRTELARGVWADWTGRVRPAQEGVRGRTLQLREPYLTDHAPADSLFHRRDDLAGARAVTCVPLVSQKQILGLLWAGRRAPFTDPETRIIRAVADMAASAIHRVGVMETLEEHVQERTRALEEANLRLQELDDMKSDFVSNVSHELRTPIANILLYLDLLGDITRENRRGEYQAILRREADRLARLIEDLLTLSRLERDRVQLSFEAHPLDPILGEVVSAQRAKAEAKGTRLIHEPDPDLPAAWVSREQIVQVFTNLVGNAVAYTPQGGTVLVSTRGVRAHGRRHLVGQVHNSGSPIPPEDLPHIFDRFYRGQNARLSGEPGTGLGLAICKDIVERHHGWIEVESNASVGTTFSVWLPVSPP